MSSPQHKTRRALSRTPLYIALLAFASLAGARDAVVMDAVTGAPLPLAQGLADGKTIQADEHGTLNLPSGTRRLAARAPGHERLSMALTDGEEAVAMRLHPITPKALYLSPFGIAHAGLRANALELAADTEINALVIDVKGDRSIVPFPSEAYSKAGLGPQKPVTVRDMASLLAQLKARGLYLIARVVTFKDDRLAIAHPQWAVHDHANRVWRDREGLAWIDPFRQEAWSFSLGVAQEAAQLGFDEIQFDYVRFPDALGLVFSEPNTRTARVDTINRFLAMARARLAPFNVFVSADIFGYVCWNEGDTQIGQDIDTIVHQVDYVSPMLYPSGFTFGIPGHRQPVAEPYAIVHATLLRALQRTGVDAIRFRPWLQAFRDYAFDRRPFTALEVQAQIDAAQALGTNGWMLWNPGNRYTGAGLKPTRR